MTTKEDLISKLDIIKSNIPQNEWRYYHILSIENFIFHLSEIKSERSKERIIIDIENYLDAITIILGEEMDNHQKYKDLFPAIYQLSEIYKYDLGFIKRPSIFVSLILFGITFLILKLSFNTLQSFIISTIIFSVYSIYVVFKIKSKKYFF